MGHVIWEREVVQAQNPYYAELAGVPIYNLVELEYFLQKYFYLMDQSVFNDNLVAFLHTEMNRPDLAKIAYGNVGKIHPVVIASKIISGIDPLMEAQSQKWREKAAKYQGLSHAKQSLLRADIYYERNQFEQAKERYEVLLQDVKAEKVMLEPDDIGKICYHLSRIAMESLSWKAAGAYLQEAYLLTEDKHILKELYMLTCLSPDVICDSSIFRQESAKTIRGWSQEFNQKKEAIETSKSLSYYENLLQQDLMGNQKEGAKALLSRWQEDFRKINKNSCQEMKTPV